MKEALLKSGVSFGADLSWLAYVAGALTITESMVEQEKGVVIGEMLAMRLDELEGHEILGSKTSIENLDVEPKGEDKAVRLFGEVIQGAVDGFDSEERDKVVAQLKSDLAPGRMTLKT